MKIKRIFILTLFFLLIYHSSHALQITGGKIVDVIVADGGHTDSTFVTLLFNGWEAGGPGCFDIGKEGGIYVLDWVGQKVLRFGGNGKWISSFPATKKSRSLGDGIAVDNWGNIYLNESGKLVKYSTDGELFYRRLIEDDIKTKHLNPDKFILTDKNGRVYNFRGRFLDGIMIFSPKGRLKGTIYPKKEDTLNKYYDIGIVQKDVGNDIYFRTNKYLVRTSLEEYFGTGKIDTVSVLPDLLRLGEYIENPPRQKITIEGQPWILMGFDRNRNFYFYKQEYLDDDTSSSCAKCNVLKYKLENGNLTQTGNAAVYFQKSKGECSKTAFLFFDRQFLVSGDGTIYWLHGTVDTVKVSKIIFDK